MAQKASRWVSIFEEFARDVRISSKEESSDDKRGTPLVLWKSQRRFLDFVGKGLDDGIHRFYVLKGRQQGITTICLLIDTFWAAFHSNMFGALITDSEDNREKNRSIIKRYVESFPEGYFGQDFYITKNNRNYIEFSNGSRFDFKVAGTKKKSISWAEGAGYVMAHATECSKFGDGDGMESFEESMPQRNPDRLLICESTANGMNHWRSMYLSAADDPYTKRSLFNGWWAADENRIERKDPRFLQYGGFAASGEEREKVAAVAALYGEKITPEQLAWYRWRASNAPDATGLLVQNQPWTHEEAFILSGFSFFHTRQIAKDMQAIIDSPPLRVEEGGYAYQAYYYDFGNRFFDIKLHVLEDEEDTHEIELRVWEEPVPDGKYAIGFDPAWGRNEHSDQHAIEVYRCFADKLVQVAEYATANIDLKHASWVMAHLAGAYQDCMINVDVNGPGKVVLMEFDHVRELLNAEMNANLVKARDWEDALGNARWYLYHRADSMGGGYAYAFQTTGSNKPELMHNMRGAFITRELVVRSIPLLEEMRTVVQDGDKIGAPESGAGGSKDDLVFATALAVRTWINWRRPEMLAQGLTMDYVMKSERGEIGQQSRFLKGVVDRFFLTQEQRAQMEDLRPSWRTDMGLT